MIKELVPESPELHTLPFFELETIYYGIDYVSVIQFIKSVEPTNKKDSDQLYLSLLRVAIVLYGWDTCLGICF